MTKRTFSSYLFLILLFSGLSAWSVQSQSMLDDVDRLAKAIRPSPWEKAVRSITFRDSLSRDTLRTSAFRAQDTLQYNLMGILAAYAYPSKEKALEKCYNPEAILQSYQHNPYLKKILSDSNVVDTLRSMFDLQEVQRTVINIRQGPREKILEQLNDGDVYADNRMFRAQELINDYQQVRIGNAVALETASKSVRPISLEDPASLTANILSGLADWIGQQAQEEFVQTFLLKLKQDLTDKQLNLLFPNTYQYLDQLNIVNYKAIVANAKMAFSKDLNTLSLNVSNYLFESGQLDKNDPLSFSLLLVYRLVDLIQRDLPLPSILAYANGEFSRRRFESEKILHDSLIADPDLPTYKNLQEVFRTVNDSLEATYDVLIELKRSIDDTLSGIPAQERAQFTALNQEVDRLQEKLSEFTYAGLFRNQRNRFLNEVNAFLAGKIDYEALEAYPSFETYQSTFIEDPPSADELRGVGLSMIRELLRKDQGDYPILRAMRDYVASLKVLEEKVYTLSELVEASADEAGRARTYLNELRGQIDREKDFWTSIASGHELKAFDYLKSLATNVRADRSRSPRQQIEYLRRVDQLFVDHVIDLGARYPEGENSPYFRAQAPRKIYLSINRRIASDSLLLNELQATLLGLEQTGDNRPLLRSYNNATLFSNILQAGAQLMYSLAISDGKGQLHWAKPEQMAEVLNNETQRQLFLGLLYQRISALTSGYTVDSRGLANIATDVAQQFTVLDTFTDRRSAMVASIEFAGNVLNSILETPLLQTDDGDQLESLVQKFKDQGIAKVPDINRELTELFRHTANRDYRYSLENVLRLVDLFNIYPKAKKWRERLEDKIDDQELAVTKFKKEAFPNPSTQDSIQLEEMEKRLSRLEEKLVRRDSMRYRKFRNGIFRYGYFLADVAAADSPQAVQAAMETIALPVGSSQNKRLRPFSVELNAYFGGTLGYEYIIDEPAGFENKSSLNSFGLFVPVGIAFSKRLGPKSNTSMSLFLPIIDLGALTAYRRDAQEKGLDDLPDLSFANVLAPGAHLMFNFPKSPFFLGAGVQYGPNVREIEISGDFETVKALRFMLSFGVDVPILSFYGQ